MLSSPQMGKSILMTMNIGYWETLDSAGKRVSNLSWRGFSSPKRFIAFSPMMLLALLKRFTRQIPIEYVAIKDGPILQSLVPD